MFTQGVGFRLDLPFSFSFSWVERSTFIFFHGGDWLGLLIPYLGGLYHFFYGWNTTTDTLSDFHLYFAEHSCFFVLEELFNHNNFKVVKTQKPSCPSPFSFLRFHN